MWIPLIGWKFVPARFKTFKESSFRVNRLDLPFWGSPLTRAIGLVPILVYFPISFLVFYPRELPEAILAPRLGGVKGLVGLRGMSGASAERHMAHPPTRALLSQTPGNVITRGSPGSHPKEI